MIHGDNGIPNLAPVTIDKCIRRINNKLDKYYDDIVMVEEIKREKSKIAVLAYGSTARPAKGAVKMAIEKEIDVEFIRPITMWPFPEKEVREVANRVGKILVPEMNLLGQVANLVRQVIEGKAEVVKFNKVSGEPITVEEILYQIEEINKKQRRER